MMKLWAKRHRNLGSARTQVVCRLHAVLCELVPGGIAGHLYATRAARRLEGLDPDGAVASHAVSWSVNSSAVFARGNVAERRQRATLRRCRHSRGERCGECRKTAEAGELPGHALGSRRARTVLPCGRDLTPARGWE